MRFAPAATMLLKSSAVRMPPEALTPIAGTDDGAHQSDIVDGGAGGAKTGGGFHEIRAGLFSEHGRLQLFASSSRTAVSRITFTMASGAMRFLDHALDIRANGIEVTAAQAPQCSGPCRFRSSTERRCGGSFRHFDLRQRRAQGKTHDAANFDARSSKFLGDQGDPIWVHTNASEAVFLGFLADLDNVFASGVGFEQSVVDEAGGGCAFRDNGASRLEFDFKAETRQGDGEVGEGHRRDKGSVIM